MLKYIDVSGKTEDEAIAKALEQLALDRDEVSVEILAHAKSGFLGIGGSPASVRVSYDDGEPEPEETPLFRPEQRKSKEEREREEAAAAAAKAEEERRREEARKNAPRPQMPASFQPEVLQKDKKAAERAEKTARAEKKAAERAEAASAPLGEETHDEKAEQIRAFLTGLLAQMGSEAQVRVYETEKGRYKVILEGEKLGALIGRRGETLDAIQQLTSYAVNRGSEKSRARVQVDAENYREKREQSLERLADKVAAKVVKYRRNVTLEPMNAYERHVIHTALQDTPHVSTFSIGTEPNRRVVVSFDKTKQ